MGFFESLFGQRREESVESRLVGEMAASFQVMMGSSAAEASEKAREMLAQAKQEVSRRGWSAQCPNYGDWLLQQETLNPKLRSMLEALRKEGVRNEDIRSWWNAPALERVVIELSDEMLRGASFIGHMRKGLNPQQAAEQMWKVHPKFGDPEQGQGEDRPIPIELKDRIIAFMERQYSRPDLMREKMDRMSSFNALVREEIRKGTL
jgi:hypothetical protein